MKFKDIQQQYNEKQQIWKIKIRLKPKKSQRFWGWVWYFVAFPWVWLFYNIRDWRTAVCIVISLMLWSSSVWGFYLASIICGWTYTTAGAWLFGIGNAVWLWWLSPVGSPFILLVTFTAIGMKMGFNKIRSVVLKKKARKKIEESCPYKIEPSNEEVKTS